MGRGKTGGLRVKETVMHVLFLFARRFIAGETMEAAIPALRRIKNAGFSTTTDILGESVKSAEMAKEVVGEYRVLLERLKGEGLDINVSLKPSQLGLDIGTDICYENVARILEKARELGAFVRIDMEGSATTSRTIELVQAWHKAYAGVGAVIQSMLRRSPKDADALLQDGISVRLCKGAYKEPLHLAFGDKREVDRQFAELATRLIASGIYHGIATHDEKLIEHVKRYAIQHGIQKSAFEFQMLYGIRPKLQKAIIDEGWRLRLYVPFGNAWLPYTYRRLRERKENLWFVVKNLVRG